jgi:hypothetical protein
MENEPVTVSDTVIARVEKPTVALGIIVRLLQVWAVSTVAIKPTNPEFVSNTTSSVDIGTVAPEAPPDEADHFVVLDQLPAPPTQYLVAMVYFFLNYLSIYHATATQRHLEVAAFHMKPTSRRVVVTVVVGSVDVDDSNDAPHVIATAVVPVIAIQSF